VSEPKSPFSLRDLQEAVALGIGIATPSFELGTGLIPAEVFHDLYEKRLLRLGFDQWSEAYPIVTEEGRERLAELMGGDVGDI